MELFTEKKLIFVYHCNQHFNPSFGESFERLGRGRGFFFFVVVFYLTYTASWIQRFSQKVDFLKFIGRPRLLPCKSQSFFVPSRYNFFQVKGYGNNTAIVRGYSKNQLYTFLIHENYKSQIHGGSQNIVKKNILNNVSSGVFFIKVTHWKRILPSITLHWSCWKISLQSFLIEMHWMATSIAIIVLLNQQIPNKTFLNQTFDNWRSKGIYGI